MTFEQETQEFGKDVAVTLQKMVKDSKPKYLRRAIVSGNLGTPICELRAKVEIVKP